MLFTLAVLFCLSSFVAGAPCTVLTDPDERASLTAAGYTCSSGGVVCDDGSGTCRVVAVPGMCVVLVLVVVFLMFLQFHRLPSIFGQDQFPIAGQYFRWPRHRFRVSFLCLWHIFICSVSF